MEHPTKPKQQVLLAVAQGDNMTGVRERVIYNNPPKSACTCDVNSNEHQGWAISIRGKRK